MPRKKKVYGSFTDLASFRAETGMTNADISDVDALRVINDDKQEQNRILEQQMERQRQEAEQKRVELEQKRQEAELKRQEAEQKMRNEQIQRNNLQSELDVERNRRRTYEYAVTTPKSILLDVYGRPYSDVDSVARYLQKEQIKKEVRNELAEELPKVIKVPRQPRALRQQPRATKPRSRSRSSSKKKVQPKKKTQAKPRK